MYVTSQLFHAFEFEIPARQLVSLVVFISGLLIVAVGGMQFRQAGTTVHPLEPGNTRCLVRSGLYKYSRNPMYVGFLLFLVSWWLFLGNLVCGIFLPLFVLLINYLQIIPEEAMLEKKFGDQYRQYLSEVRRWI